MAADEDEDPDANAWASRYDASKTVPPCPRCNSQRVFEMQLVPGLISELKVDSLSLSGEKSKSERSSGKGNKSKAQSEEERKLELAVLLGRAKPEELAKFRARQVQETCSASSAGGSEVDTEQAVLRGESGMEWGTVMVFGCEKDCVGFGEEWVGVEWEEMQ